ncbi:hypothetical protein CPB84DRAFT_1674945 [Gymnopilus junonius]|uniref:Histone acetyltransferase n=1 Tax=Gymnopilus junonius TaxID=109634 RepID=A0A9P5TRS4_GYMJU|nr:hypothetical protein CPB84DRAFT_1674945 [Gymnopilus junonius]
MRGLAFPASSPVDRETSYEYGTPISNVDDIPIDPALGGAPIDPALMMQGDGTNVVPVEAPLVVKQYQQPPQTATNDYNLRLYSQGPQGDPFAPQVPMPYFPIEREQPPPPPPKIKRRRKVYREEECSFCQGNETKNKLGEPEPMLTCHECGRSGWHMDCMNPRIENPPEGEWHCPLCPPLMHDGAHISQQSTQPENGQLSPLISERQPSEASTSRSVTEVQPTSTRKRNKKGTGKSKAKAKVVTSSDSSDNEGVEDTPVISKGRGSRRKRPRERSPSPPPRVRLRIPPARGKGKEREEEEHGLFDDILGVEDRDTSKTTPSSIDKRYFERSRILAEEKLAPPPTASSSRTMDSNDNSTPSHSRPLRSATLQHLSTPRLLDLSNSPGPSTPGASLPKFEPGVLRIRSIRFGPYDIKTWYDAPFPEEYASIPDGRLWICEFCLKYMKSRFKAIRHQMKCKMRHPPGDEIYRDGSVSIFEVDGRRNKIYCQNLCLLSKMFLDHKSLFYDVEPFLFYVITQVDDFGARFVGYFSKEKRCPKDYNLSCIMTLPVRQRQGWGNLIIDFSYLLSKIEQRTGSPEKPLSSLGALGYKNYWTLAIMRYLEKAPDNVRLEDISTATSMTLEDICNTLIQLKMIFIREGTPSIRPSPGQSIKFPKGRKNGVARKHLRRMQTQDRDSDGHSKTPFVAPKHYEIHFDHQKVEDYLAKWEAKGYLKLKPEKLQWTPYLVTRTTQEAAVNIDLPVMDTAPDEPSEMVPVITAPPPSEPVTPGPAPNGTVVDSPPAPALDANELPMVVDGDSPGPRTRTRSSNKSPTKEKDQTSRPPRVSHPVSPPSSPPPVAPPRSVRTRSSQLNVQSPVVDVPTPTRSTRRSNASRQPSKKEEPVNEDEILASKLALEEQTPGRTLRSGRVEIPTENKRPAPITRTVSVRKRRRIESSPEQDESLSPSLPEVSEPAAVEENGVGETPMAVDSEVPEPLPAPKVNGDHNGHLEREGPLETQTPPETVAASPEETAEEAKEVVGQHEADVKSEDQGTPLTSLTSRQSLPSDDTVCITEEGPSKLGEYQEGVHGEGDMQRVVEMDLDDCHDEDADGEYEEDDEYGEVIGISRECLARWLSANKQIYCEPNHFNPLRLDFGWRLRESTMQYGHMPLQERRDPNLDGSGSNGLGQALGAHLGPAPAYPRPPPDYRNPSTSPPTLQAVPSHPPAAAPSHSPLTFAPVQSAATSPAIKRKQVDGPINPHTLKRRRDAAAQDDADSYDMDGGAQGAKHWTDEEKSKLFSWLMGPGQEEHWNALRATKNSCLRDCAQEVFGGKKTYQALKGCYERNFNLFKQIYAFETAHGQPASNSNIAQLGEADRLREYERRLQIARKAGSDVGNITARTIDHWHRVGWYDLFYRRWHGDPATTRPVQNRNPGVGNTNLGGGDEPEEEEPTIDFNDPSSHMNGLNGLTHDRQQQQQQHQQHHVFINPQDLRENPPPSLSQPSTHPHPLVPPPQPPPQSSIPPDTALMNIAITQDFISGCLHYLNLQAKVAQEKLDYIRRREARELSEHNAKKEQEKSANSKNKTEKAFELINNPNADANLKQAATEYLRKMFLQD